MVSITTIDRKLEQWAKMLAAKLETLPEFDLGDTNSERELTPASSFLRSTLSHGMCMSPPLKYM